ncbi:MAG: DEAD/DEAH box helicase [Candidatus Micrarchaeia archaeon]
MNSVDEKAQEIDVRWYELGPAAGLLRLEGLAFRSYQFNIIKSISSGKNTLVILPTGLGKTLIGISAIANALYNGKKALFLAPTKPLCEQHDKTLRELLKIESEKVLLLTGALGKERRIRLEEGAKVIVATPQTVANDLKNGILSLENFGIIVFDECHRAVGKYAYTYIAEEAEMRNIQVVGLTASPGGRSDRIKALIESLRIDNIEVRISTDEDVAQYVMPKHMHIINVENSERIKNIAELLKPIIEESLLSLNRMGLTNFKRFENLPKGRLIEIGSEISKIEARNYKFGAMFSYIKLLNLVHAYDLVVTEGLYAFNSYFVGLANREKKSRAIENILNNGNVIIARRLSEEGIKLGEEHPKVFALFEILKGYSGKSAIVFAQYRSTIKMLVEMLTKHGFNAMPFVGKKEGVTQAQQKQVINDFEARKFDILVASSIGEEGLDIPSVDLVIFYEPIPNEIRNIQRRGRTGRFRAGDIFILVANGTKDEVYLMISRQREKKMLEIINSIKLRLSSIRDGQKRLR